MATAPESEDREALCRRLAGSPEVDALTSRITLDDTESIVTFGAKAAADATRAADAVLTSLSRDAAGDSGGLLGRLAAVIQGFDPGDLREDNSFLGRLFGRNRPERILEKYQTMGEELGRLYVQLKQYEGELRRIDHVLAEQTADLEAADLALLKYILAAEQGCREVRDYIAGRRAEGAENSEAGKLELLSLEQSLRLLERRTAELRTSEQVALQALPLLKMMRLNNERLMQEIDTAFLVTLPVFREALGQILLQRRSRLRAEALSAVEARTRAELAGQEGGAAALRTLAEARQTILRGIDEVRALQADRPKTTA